MQLQGNLGLSAQSMLLVTFCHRYELPVAICVGKKTPDLRFKSSRFGGPNSKEIQVSFRCRYSFQWIISEPSSTHN